MSSFELNEKCSSLSNGLHSVVNVVDLSRGVTFGFKCRFHLEVRALITYSILVLLTA